MTVIVDAGVLFAQADADDAEHEAVVRILGETTESLVTSELAIAEADYLILTRLGIGAELAFIQDLAFGAFTPECLTRDEIHLAHDQMARYRDLRLGLADASLVVLAYRYRTNRILTFDERAFRTVVPIQGGHFIVLPADGDSGRQ